MAKKPDLSSPYQEMFKTDQPLSPGARKGKRAMFPTSGDRNVDTEAKTRALAVIRYKHEEELREVYLAEVEYLKSARKDLISNG